MLVPTVAEVFDYSPFWIECSPLKNQKLKSMFELLMWNRKEPYLEIMFLNVKVNKFEKWQFAKMVNGLVSAFLL